MPGDPKLADTAFIIIYRNREPFCNSCESAKVEGNIRYWLGKSPGMYRDEIERIVSCPKSALTDRTYMLEKIRQEEEAFEDRQREAAEREQYERLRKKFETKT